LSELRRHPGSTGATVPEQDAYAGSCGLGGDSNHKTGTETTPGPDDRTEEGRDEAPRWFLLLIVVVAAVGGLWIPWSFFNISRPA
jgi:hypothetical protein